MRPMFPYYGSKWNIARHYPAPGNGLVIEPFAGGAGYASFYGAKQVFLIDKDPIIAGLWWLTNWNVPFADEDEWQGDRDLFKKARDEAARVLAAVSEPSTEGK